MQHDDDDEKTWFIMMNILYLFIYYKSPKMIIAKANKMLKQIDTEFKVAQLGSQF